MCNSNVLEQQHRQWAYLPGHLEWLETNRIITSTTDKCVVCAICVSSPKVNKVEGYVLNKISRIEGGEWKKILDYPDVSDRLQQANNFWVRCSKGSTSWGGSWTSTWPSRLDRGGAQARWRSQMRSTNMKTTSTKLNYMDQGSLTEEVRLTYLY